MRVFWTKKDGAPLAQRLALLNKLALSVLSYGSCLLLFTAKHYDAIQSVQHELLLKVIGTKRFRHETWIAFNTRRYAIMYKVWGQFNQNYWCSALLCRHYHGVLRIALMPPSCLVRQVLMVRNMLYKTFHACLTVNKKQINNITSKSYS